MKRFAVLLSVAGLLSGCRETTAPEAAASKNAPAAPLLAVAADAGWSSIAGMTEVRYAHASAAAPDGRVYVFGGLWRQAVLSAEAFDPAAGTWSSVASPGANILGGAAVASNGLIYLVAGADGNLAASRALRVFDPVAGTWSAAADLNGNRFGHAVAVAGGRIYAIGGTVTGSQSLVSGEVYDVGSNSWTSIADMTIERQAHAAVGGRDGKVYVFGGMTNAGGTSASEVYDPATNAWSSIAPMPVASYGHAAALGGDGLIYVFGGLVAFVPQNSVFIYDPQANSWTTAPAMSIPRYIPSAATTKDGYIYVTGGRTSGNVVVGSAERFLTAAANGAPVALASLLEVSECVAGFGRVVLDGSGSSDPDGDPLSYKWLSNGEVVAIGATAELELSVGSHEITLQVADDEQATAEAQLNVSVADTRAPVIVYNQLVSELRPPNHSMRKVAFVSASDVCQGGAEVHVSVGSNEPVDPGESDWEVVPADDGYEVWVRSERLGGGFGRIYTIDVTASDESGNQAIDGGSVVVPSGNTGKVLTAKKTAKGKRAKR